MKLRKREAISLRGRIGSPSQDPLSIPPLIMRSYLPDPQSIPQHIMDNRIHEVFLSFRGEDTRASFTSHLYASLQNAGITVFKDDESLPRGDCISTSLLQAIEKSQISVVVFSRNYAESRWCLQELQKILACHRTIGQVVLPVFYRVDPSEVRHQTGQFGKAFEKLSNRILKEEEEVPLRWKELQGKNDISESKKTVNSALTGEGIVLGWRKTLREAAGISGVVVLNSREQKLLRD
ncbi:TMV resistance protein N [Spatholobus suberectus]|nr:TMV resistance protein N [Spatholobus suberectus]